MHALKETEKPPTRIASDPRWAQVLARDVHANFFYSVQTTGVYCRPSCAARRPRPENTRFYQTCAAAEAAGFRPCKRCRPDQPLLPSPHAELIALACRRLEDSENVPNLKQLAAGVGMSPFHFHRAFKAVTGVTPKQFATAHRTKRVRANLTRSETVTDAIYDAGFQSGGRFYETANAVLGMTPSNYRAGGKDTDILFAIGQCSLGSILVARSERGVCAISMGDDPAALLQELQDQFPNATLIGNDRGFDKTVAQVIGMVEHPGASFDLPLDIRGTAFQQRVWQALQQIPSGSTATYTGIAKSIGLPNAVRAVAQACAANSLAIAIPCHRVVRTDGSLSGYRWGVERKRALLQKEGAKGVI